MDSYGRRVVVGVPFAVAVDETVRALEDELMEVVGRLDVGKFLNRTLHHDFRRYVLLDVASPQLMLEALQQDLAVGAILRTAVAVFELADRETAVVVAEPFGDLGSNLEWRRTTPSLAALADAASEQLARALDRLEHAAHAHAAVPVPAATEQLT